MDSTRRPISLIMNSFSIDELMKRRTNVGTGRSRKGTSIPQTNRQNIPERDQLLCAIYETKSMRPEVGLAFLYPNTSTLVVTQIVDSPTYIGTIHKISVHLKAKMQMIVPNSYINPRLSTLVKIIRGNFPEDVTIIGVKEKYFSCSSGLEHLGAYFHDSWGKTDLPEIRTRTSLCSALFASVRYMNDSNHFDYIHDKFKFRYEAPDSTMFMDMNTIKSLELVVSKDTSSKGLTLFSFLDQTETPMGKRLLRANILQPLTDKESIISRHEAIQEIIDNTQLLKLIKSELKSCFDLDKLFSFLTRKPKITLDSLPDQKINHILMLKESLTLCHRVSCLLETFNSELLRQINNILQHEHISNALALINEYINEDCIWARKPLELKTQQCHAIKSRTNGLLDINRQLYKELVDEILDSVSKLGDEHQLLLEAKYNTSRGFYIQVKNPPNELPELFITRSHKKDSVECTTLNLMKLNMRVESVLNEVLLISEQIVELLTTKLKLFLSTFFMISEAVSLLDLLSCLASSVAKSSLPFASPEISDSTMIKQSRHPLLETFMKLKFIPNDIISLRDTSRVQIITGINMSGKSVYLRQICLIQIMAQIGAFVPADYASIRLYKSLHARISPDAMQENMSTFSSEMTDISFILERADEDSLVIIDELCRGTSYMEGISLSIAIIEKLIKLKCTVFMSTHCTDIAKILKDQTCVLEVFMGVNVRADKFIMTYKLATGVNKITGYGIQSLKLLDQFPSSILDKASEIADAIRKSNENSIQDPSDKMLLMTKKKLILDFYTSLKHVFKFSSDETLVHQLRLLETSFVNTMAELMDNPQSEDGLLLSVGHDDATDVTSDQSNMPGQKQGDGNQLNSADDFINFDLGGDDSK